MGPFPFLLSSALAAVVVTTTFIRRSSGIPGLLTHFPLACSRVTRSECPEGDKSLGYSKCQEDFPKEVTVVLSGSHWPLSSPTRANPLSLSFPLSPSGRLQPRKEERSPRFSSPVSPLAKYQATHLSAGTHPQLLQA